MAGALDGKAVVITGAGRGIGAAYAAGVAGLGGRVVVNDLDADLAEAVAAAIRATGAEAVADGSDVTSWEQARSLLDHCVDQFGAVDGLVNNAGLYLMGTPEEYTAADWRAVIDANVLGTAFCGTHAAAHMTRQGGGSIVNVTSGSSLGTPLQSLYGASKGAVTSLTYAWATDLGPRGIRVNAVSPMAATRMADTVQAYFADRQLPPWPTLAVPATQNVGVVTFLLSDAAAGLNGQVVRVDDARLSVMTHPAVQHPPRLPPAGTWTHDDVVAAFADGLADHQFPLGVVATRAEILDYPSGWLPPAEEEEGA